MISSSRHLFRALAAPLLLASCALAQAAPAPVWHDRLEPALAEAEAGQRYLLVDLYADWCAWCKKLESEVFPTATFRHRASELVLLKVDTEDGGEGADLKRRYGVATLPTTLILNPDRVLVGSIVGYAEADRLVAAIDRKIAEWEALEARWRAITDASPASEVEAVALELHRRQDGRRAAPLYRRVRESTAPSDRTTAAWLLYREADAERLAGRFASAAELTRRAGTTPHDDEELRQRVELLASRIDHDRGDCAGAIAGLESFLESHPESSLRRHARSTLTALRAGDAQCG